MFVSSSLDHLVVAADTLEEGVAWVEQHLGVSPQPGGEHPRMGTHNQLLRLGDDAYLEVIAIKPGAPSPGRPRWFQLDAPARPLPGLITWAARCNDIHQAVQGCTLSPGTIQPMSRGELSWKITIPDDGELQLNGQLPALIQWDTPTLPPSRLPDQGCSLLRLELHHSRADDLQQHLHALNFSGKVQVHACPAGKEHMVAVIQTPSGLVSLR